MERSEEEINIIKYKAPRITTIAKIAKPIIMMVLIED